MQATKTKRMQPTQLGKHDPEMKPPGARLSPRAKSKAHGGEIKFYP